MADILIVEDKESLRTMLRTTLESRGYAVDEAGDAYEARKRLQAFRYLVVLTDLKLPAGSGLDVLRAAREADADTPVVVMTAFGTVEEAVQAMKLGCSGIVLKQTSADLIVKSNRKVYAGEIWLDSHTTAAVMRQFATPGETTVGPSTSKIRERSPLSTREREIVALVAQGYKNKEMAEKMFISEQTVKNHLHNIFDKLGVSDRLELALYAIHNNLHTGR